MTCCAVACASDPTCQASCATNQVAWIFVSATNAPQGPATGLTMTITGPFVPEPSGCSVGFGAEDMCIISGGPGDYNVTLTAPGYQPSVVSFKAPPPSKPDACGCQDFFTQRISVVMQPATD